jgi:hypothetical protein
VTEPETAEPTAEPTSQWTPRRQRGLHLRVDRQRLDDVLIALTGHPMTSAQRRQLFWFRMRTVARSVGWLAGLVSFLLVMVTLLTLVVVGVLRFAGASDFTAATTRVVADVIIVGTSLWIYLYVLMEVFDPKTSFARAAFDTVRYVPSNESGWAPSNGLAFANASGRAAKSLFRAITGKRINVVARPDVADRALAIAERILVTVPPTGWMFWRTHTEQARSYACLLHDVTGLIAIDRLDLIQETIDRNEVSGSDILAEPGIPDMARYMHPLGRRTVLDAVAQYLLPVAAFAVSVIAVTVTLAKR